MKNILLVLLPFLILSCASTDYSARSVENARKKVVEELTLLSDADRFEIKFGTPYVFQNKLLNRSDNSHISKNDVCHTWIVWKLPETQGKCVVVSGVSEARMDDWKPDRVVIRDISDLDFFEKEKSEKEKIK
jgi:hypothetical protein